MAGEAPAAVAIIPATEAGNDSEVEGEAEEEEEEEEEEDAVEVEADDGVGRKSRPDIDSPMGFERGRKASRKTRWRRSNSSRRRRRRRREEEGGKAIVGKKKNNQTNKLEIGINFQLDPASHSGFPSGRST